MNRDVIAYLEDILTAIDDIVTFAATLDFEDFKQDRKTVYAVTRALEIMGEAAKNIPTEVRQTYNCCVALRANAGRLAVPTHNSIDNRNEKLINHLVPSLPGALPAYVDKQSINLQVIEHV